MGPEWPSAQTGPKKNVKKTVLVPNSPEVGAKEVLQRLTWLGDARHSLKRFLFVRVGCFFITLKFLVEA
jgi:hypothetical protein